MIPVLGKSWSIIFMCNLKHNGGKSFFAAVLAVGAFAVASTLASSAVIAQGTRDLSPDQLADSKEQKPPITLWSVDVNGRTLSGISNESLHLPAHPDIT